MESNTAPDITIPNEALERAKQAYLRELETGADPVRAACLAMLKAWPGNVHYRGGWEPVVHNRRKPHLILPLPQENSDAEG